MIKKILILVCLIPALPAMAQPIVINEIAAAIVNSQVDDYGEYEDWIELYNPTDRDIDIGGWFITDKLSKPTKWQIPSTHPKLTTVRANDFLVLYADGDTTQGVTHLGFSLKKKGEELRLFTLISDSLVLVDSVRYDELPGDCSYGRCPTQPGEWLILKKPTPGKTNNCPMVARPKR